MKTEEELKEWFWDMYNSCYIVKHEDYTDSYYLYYDENFIRQAKLKTILDEEIIYPIQPNGKFLFELDWKNNRLWINYNTIWLVLETELGYNYQEIKNLITDWLNEHDKLKVLTPITKLWFFQPIVNKHYKLKVLTPLEYANTSVFYEHNKLKVLKNEN